MSEKALKPIDPNQPSRFKRWIVRMWTVSLIGLGVFCLYLFILSFSTPSFRELEDPNTNLASEVISEDNKVLGRYYVENRVRIPYDKLSPNLIKALVATEDVRYMSHSGIDPEALGRVFVGMITLNPKGGGSTITQQLAKLLYSDRNFSGMGTIRKALGLANRKFSEWITAVKLERRYTKEEIIAMYFNQVDYVNGAVGIKAASEIYFSKSPDSLSILECATLVGMLQNPSLYNPVKRAERCRLRRNVVLKQMVVNNVLSDSQYKKLYPKAIELDFQGQTHSEGVATYFRSELAEDVKTILINSEVKKADGQNYNIYKDGLKIYTTLDYDLQQMAEAAAVEHMKAVQARFFTVWKGKDPWTYKGGDDAEVDVERRKRSLNRDLRGTDRYQQMRSAALDEMLVAVKAVFEIDLTDNEIDLIVAEIKKSGAISQALKDKSIDNKKADLLSDIADSDEGAQLKGKWTVFQTLVQKVFNTKVKMKVFAYTETMQKDTTMSPLDSIRYHRMFLQLGAVVMSPTSGHIKAWVGGVNHKYFQFDHCRTYRQVGSTFKPFVYATAIAQQSISPCFKVLDVANTIQPNEGAFGLSKSWTPRNAGGYSGKSYTLYEGLRESVNTVSVHLLKQLGSTEPVRGLVNNMGIDSSKRMANGTPMLTRQPALSLGACDLTVLQMTGAYSTFANNGTYVKPVYLLRIEDKNGKIIYEHTPEEENALPAAANYVMLDMLKYVAKGAPGISSLKSEVGGKTGTTNNYVDGWYMGLTPNLVVGTWVGGEEKWLRFLNINDGQGARMARPFFAAFMKRVEANPTLGEIDISKRFARPAGDLGITTDCLAFNQAVEGSTLDPTEFDTDPFADPDKKPQKDSTGKVIAPKKNDPDGDF